SNHGVGPPERTDDRKARLSFHLQERKSRCDEIAYYQKRSDTWLFALPVAACAVWTWLLTSAPANVPKFVWFLPCAIIAVGWSRVGSTLEGLFLSGDYVRSIEEWVRAGADPTGGPEGWETFLKKRNRKRSDDPHHLSARLQEHGIWAVLFLCAVGVALFE